MIKHDAVVPTRSQRIQVPAAVDVKVGVPVNVTEEADADGISIVKPLTVPVVVKVGAVSKFPL
jgi:hypothetical protein